jgi:hypothetical protein
MTEDRYRGRVFSAEFALYMLTLAISSFLAGQLLWAKKGSDAISQQKWRLTPF